MTPAVDVYSGRGKEKMSDLDNLKIYEFVAENFKKLRIVRLTPTGSVTEITGPNSAGKTSVIEAIWFLLKGVKGLPVKSVRIGAEQLKVTGHIGNEKIEFKVTRTLKADAETPTLKIEMIKGKRDTTPEEFLGQIFDILTSDPLEFLRMSAKEKIAKLRETAKVDLDFEALDTEHKLDYEKRGTLNKEYKAIEARIAAMTTAEGLPLEKLDEDSILKKLEEAGEANRKAQEVFKAKQDLEFEAAKARSAITQNENLISDQQDKIAEIERTLRQAQQVLAAAEKVRESLALKAGEIQARYEAAPAGDPIDVTALTAELQSAQRTNRAIDAWRAKEMLRKELAAKEREWSDVDNRMKDRDERRRVAVASARIPVDGLTFNESMTEVRYKGQPLESLGEGEQIRLSTSIAMAANPKLRVLCIRRGEALDNASRRIIYEMAAENKFQIFMARVDESGQVGLVLEDGVIVKRNPPAAVVPAVAVSAVEAADGR